MELKDCVFELVRFRLAHKRVSVPLKETNSSFSYDLKGVSYQYFFSDVLSIPSCTGVCFYACLNTPENIAFLVENWDAFLQDRLTILFMNPSVNMFWKIAPKSHALISDAETLEQGIRSLAEQVPFV